MFPLYIWHQHLEIQRSLQVVHDVSGNTSFAGKLYYVAFIDQAIIIWLLEKKKKNQHLFITI